MNEYAVSIVYTKQDPEELKIRLRAVIVQANSKHEAFGFGETMIRNAEPELKNFQICNHLTIPISKLTEK